MTLSPQEKWAKEKERQKLIAEGKDPDQDPLMRPVGPPTPDFKKPGEYCPHPPGRITIGEGRTIGKIRVCQDCGRIVNDPDLRD